MIYFANFNITSPPVPLISTPPAYLILPNVPTPLLIRTPLVYSVPKSMLPIGAEN